MLFFLYFFFNDTATTEIYTLSLHDALPIFRNNPRQSTPGMAMGGGSIGELPWSRQLNRRSEEHTSELQSRLHLVCRLLLEKKKKTQSKFKQQQPPILITPTHMTSFIIKSST